ncbi:flavo protein monooxygenase [Pyrenochaeta sp. DS3sAY3a]|nr:flavo protein monooxygenase [Pyrenochaeta sp. DS3sAY3a]
MSISKQLPSLNILISGAGIAGPCLAYWLSKTRLNPSITIVERSPVPRVTGQAIDIRGGAIKIVEKMGLKTAIQERNTTEIGTRIVNAKGNAIAEFGKGDTFTAEHEILRADLCGLFLDATAKLPNVKYVYDDSITSIDQKGSKVDVSFATSAEESFDLVVGADGSTSSTRPMVLSPQVLEGSYNFIGQYIAFFSIPRQPSDTKHWYWYNASKGRGLMIRPHRTDSTVGVYVCVTTSSRGKKDPAMEEAMRGGPEAQRKILQEYFADAGWQAERILDGMERADDFYMSRAAQVKLPCWHKDRCVLIGDAAFATFGIGTTLAIESAYFLAGEISKVQTREQIPQALDRYEKVFREIYTKSEDLPPGFPQLAFPQTAWGLRLRDSALWLVSKTGAYKLLPSEAEDKSDVPNYDWVGC